jgi:uncharacterized protein YprB with RNaseH-like and TPR domain
MTQANQFVGEWSKEEDKILKKHYPIIGSKVIEFFPNRSLDAIDHRVRRLGIKYGLFPIGEEAYLDIETTNLRADFAYMISYALKVKGKDEVLSGVITKEEIFSEEFDKRLVEQCLTDLRKFKRIYTYYGTKFDIPFLRSRSLKWKLNFPVYGVVQHQDIYYMVKSKLCLSRNRLEAVCEFLGIEGKTKLSGDIWVRAAVGNAECLKYIYTHNVADVAILEQAHERIKQFADVNKRSI